MGFNALNQLFYGFKGHLGGQCLLHIVHGGFQNGHGPKCRGVVVGGPAHAATLRPPMLRDRPLAGPPTVPPGPDRRQALFDGGQGTLGCS